MKLYTLVSILICMLLGMQLIAADHPAVHLPTEPVLVQPIELVPEPVQVIITPTLVSNIPANTWYVVESKTRLLPFGSPSGMINIKEYQCALSTDTGVKQTRYTFMGRFADGNGSFDEERTYPSQPDYNFIYTVHALKQGTVELILDPVGIQIEEERVRHTLTLMGIGPLPPPIPDPNPEPEPDPKPPTGVRVLIIYNENASLKQLDVINSLEVINWMDTNTVKGEDGRPEWRRWDWTSVSKPGMLKKETEIWQKLWATLKVASLAPRESLIFVIVDTKIYQEKIVDIKTTLSFLNKIKDGK